MVDIIEIYVHWYAGRSKTQVGASLGVDRKTVRKYLAPAEAAGIAPGGPPMGEADWAKLIKTWFPGQAERGLNQITWPEIDQHRDYIKTMLETTTVTTIHQRLRDEGKLRASISSFRRWVHENLPDEAARSKVTVLRDDVEPGSEAQIHYGFLGQWINPGTGKRHRIRAFVMVLPCSRHMFVRPVIHMDQHAWTEAHAEAFRFFGGVPRRLVPDNLKTGVDKPDLYDPKINKAYAELALHYRALVDPARAVHPKDKPRVERPMPYVRDSFWSGRQFASLEHMQADALIWGPGDRRGPAVPTAGWGRPAGGVRRGRGPGPAPAAGQAFRAGPLVHRHRRPGHPCQGRPHPLLGALEADRPPRRRSLHRHHGPGLPRGPTGQIPHRPGTGKTHRQRRLPAGEDRVPDEDPALVPGASIRGRGPLPGRGRPTAGGQRPLPPPGRPGDPRAAQEVQRQPSGGRLREGPDRRRPLLPHHQGHPDRRHQTDPEPETGDAGAAAFLHGPEGLFPTDIPTQTLGELHYDQGHDDAEEAAR